MVQELSALSLHLNLDGHGRCAAIFITTLAGVIELKEQLVGNLVLEDLHALLVKHYLTELAR